jgi:hypothetical protein
MNINPNCDGAHCQSANGEVRLLSLGRQANSSQLHLCYSCYRHEMAWRREENKALAQDAQFEIPAWETLKKP